MDERNTARAAAERRKKALRKKRREQQKRIITYSSVLIAFVILVAIIIGAGVGKRNNELLAAETTAEQESASVSDKEAEKKPDSDSNKKDNASDKKDNSSDTKDKNESEPSQTEAPKTTEPETVVQAMKPGTINNPAIITIDEEKWYMTLVNSSYRIPDDYEPDLVYVCGSSERLDKKVAVHYEKMYNAALKDGVTLTPCSGYRSYELQERNYNNKISFYESQGYSYEDAKVKAATIIMPPGSSEHNLGYAMDIICVDEWFEDTDAFRWLTENAADYGFIMRYPKDKQDVTKVIYEPWHWRYVGVELAKELNESGLVLEEYMGVA